jgi:hypothetical protein
MSKIFLRYWLLVSLTTLGTYVAYSEGIFGMLDEADATKLSFVILAIYMLYSIVIGYVSYTLKNVSTFLSVGWFLSETMLALGMIGTVLGFILMLGGSMAELDINDSTKTTEVLGKMAAGMSTALYTTAVGLICSTLLKVKLVNLEVGVK